MWKGKVVISSETLSRSAVRDFNPIAHEYEAGVLITRPGVAPVWTWYIVQFRFSETVIVAAQHVIFVGRQTTVMGSTWGVVN
jgi:hypothetical protein